MIILVGSFGSGIYEYDDARVFDDAYAAGKFVKAEYPHRVDEFVMLHTWVDHGYRSIEEVPREEWFVGLE